MKIFFPLDAFYPSQIGGPCNTLYWHTCELKKQDIDTSIVTTTLGIKPGYVIENETLHRECGLVFYGTGNSINLKTIRTAFTNLKDCDIVHLNSFFSPFVILCFLYLKICRRSLPIVWSVRGELSQEALKFSSWKKKPVLLFYKLLINNILFHSTSGKETLDIKKYFNDVEIFEVPNLIKPYERLKSISIKKQILYLGRIHPIKALHKIIEGLALSEFFINSGYTFVIVGTYEDRHLNYYNQLLSLIESRGISHKVEFKGHLGGVEKEVIYAESYFTLLLSESENFGNVVLESLNQGTPVLASTGTPWSILNDWKCGAQITNEPMEIATSIDKILNISDVDYESYRKNACSLVDSKFDISTQIEKWITKYNFINNG